MSEGHYHAADLIDMEHYIVYREPRYRAGKEWEPGRVFVDYVRFGVAPREGPSWAHEPLENVGYHSPSGFEMGYGGSGPADTALTVLLHVLRVPIEEARRVLKGEVSADLADTEYVQNTKRAWAASRRLKEEKIARDRNFLIVTRQEVARLLTLGSTQADPDNLELFEQPANTEGAS